MAKRKGGLQSRDAMGLALDSQGEPSLDSYAFYKPITEAAERSSVPVSVVTAQVMAHEIGHLLGMKHSRSGIMKPSFEGRDLREAAAGRLNFAAEDRKRLRAAVVVLVNSPGFRADGSDQTSIIQPSRDRWPGVSA